MDAPERWLAQDVILREARFVAYTAKPRNVGMAHRLVGIARELGPLNEEHARCAGMIERDYLRDHSSLRAAA